MRIHIVEHERFEAPAAIAFWAEHREHETTYTRLHAGAQFPADAAAFDLLIVMGGPQSPATTLEECSYFDAAKEIAFIQTAIRAEKKILGICLGAQLLGESLGAAFDHSPNREIGVFDLTLTEAGKKDPLFSVFPDTFAVGHWHGDMPGLTDDSEILATSAGCPRQIVRYSPRLYGFQCHFELTREAIEGMNENCHEELEAYKDLSYVESAEELLSHDYDEMNARLFVFLDYLVEL